MDEIDEYILEISDNVRDEFWKRIETDVIPEVRDFMKNELSAKKIIEVVLTISVSTTLKEVLKNPAKFLRMASLR